MTAALAEAVFRRHESSAQPVVAIIGRESEALDELQGYLRCCSSRRVRSSEPAARKDVLVCLGDHFTPAEVGWTLHEVYTADVVAAVLITERPAAFVDLMSDRRLGPTLVILQTPANPWIILSTVRACFDAGAAPLA